jgi:hypothetical protein
MRTKLMLIRNPQPPLIEFYWCDPSRRSDCDADVDRGLDDFGGQPSAGIVAKFGEPFSRRSCRVIDEGRLSKRPTPASAATSALAAGFLRL